MVRDRKVHYEPARSGWTGGQYSIFRVIFGVFLFAQFAQLTGWSLGLFLAPDRLLEPGQGPVLSLFASIPGLDDASGFAFAVTLSAAAASLLFIVGIADKWAAFCMCFALACLFGLNPLIAEPSLTYLGWMLVAHMLMPGAPYGSLAARGRLDPGGRWRFPIVTYCITLLLFVLSYQSCGWSLVYGPSWVLGEDLFRIFVNPLPHAYFALPILAWAPPALIEILGWSLLLVVLLLLPIRRLYALHPVLWSMALGLQLCFAVLFDFADPTSTMLLFHLLVFNPAWIRSRRLPQSATLFYDGSCGLCHRSVRFLLAEDTLDDWPWHFTYSPIGSNYFKATLTAGERLGLPDTDSIVLKSEDGLLVGADALIRILKMLGGLWLPLALALSVFPATWRNAAYRFVATRRYRWFGRTETACPNVPDHLRTRFREHA